MNLVDTSGWIEYFLDGPNADFFAGPIERTGDLLVSTINLYEVCKHFTGRHLEEEAIRSLATMHEGKVIAPDALMAHVAARLAVEHELPMADSIILATSRVNGARLWTQDEHFEGLEGVRYRKRKPA